MARPYVTYAEYLALEEKSLTKHEWLDGVIYDMEALGMAGRSALPSSVTSCEHPRMGGEGGVTVRRAPRGESE